MDDLSAASVDDVATFFKTYYAPNNAVIAIVGDVDTKKTMALVEKYFGTISAQPQPQASGHDRAAADRRAAQHARGSARAPAAPRHRLDHSAGASPDSDALDVLCDDSVERPQLALQPVDRPREAARDERPARSIRTARGPGSVPGHRDGGAGQVRRRRSRRPSTPRSRRSRPGRSRTGRSRRRRTTRAASRRSCDQNTLQPRRSSSASTRCSTTTRT